MKDIIEFTVKYTVGSIFTSHNIPDHLTDEFEKWIMTETVMSNRYAGWFKYLKDGSMCYVWVEWSVSTSEHQTGNEAQA